MSLEHEFEPKPDRVDRLIRFVFGFVIASGLSFLFWQRVVVWTGGWWLLLIMVLIGGAIGGFYTAFRGNRFWNWLRDLFDAYVRRR